MEAVTSSAILFDGKVELKENYGLLGYVVEGVRKVRKKSIRSIKGNYSIL